MTFLILDADVLNDAVSRILLHLLTGRGPGVTLNHGCYRSSDFVGKLVDNCKIGLRCARVPKSGQRARKKFNKCPYLYITEDDLCECKLKSDVNNDRYEWIPEGVVSASKNNPPI